jgi:hypothetical protein
MVIVWGLIILSMLVNVIFNIVVLTPFEGWAIDWLDQYELCEQEREEAAAVLGLWWQYKLDLKKKGGKVSDDGAAETQYVIKLVQCYKKLRETSYMIDRNDTQMNSDEMTEIQVGIKEDLKKLTAQLAGAKEAAVADDEDDLGAEEPTSDLLEPLSDRVATLSSRLVAFDEMQTATLSNINKLYGKDLTDKQPPPAQP